MSEPVQSLQQRYFPDLPCFGCGPANERGLRLNSYVEEDGAIRARFLPWPEHDNGLGFLNGGIIATLLDCHSAAAVTHEAFERGWPPLPGADLPSLLAANQGLADLFLPLARETLAKAGATWPQALEDATRAHLARPGGRTRNGTDREHLGASVTVVSDGAHHQLVR